MSVVDPTTDAPKDLQKSLAKHGGMVPGQNRPMWRLVLAQNCLIVTNGIMHDLGDGEVSCFAMGPDGKKFYEKPLDSVKQGRFEIPKYPCEGWILERWFSQSTWGTPEEWRSHKSEDGSTIMGEYPNQGVTAITRCAEAPTAASIISKSSISESFAVTPVRELPHVGCTMKTSAPRIDS